VKLLKPPLRSAEGYDSRRWAKSRQHNALLKYVLKNNLKGFLSVCVQRRFKAFGFAKRVFLKRKELEVARVQDT